MSVSDIILRPHQVEGVEFLLKGKRRILGDEVGLGKTFTALEAARQAHNLLKERGSIGPSDGPKILVVLPPHLIFQWIEQIELYFGSSFPVMLIERGCPKIDRPGIYIISYNTMQNAGKQSTMWIWQRIWDTVIFDEAHRLRNHKSQQTRNAWTIAGRFVFMLTGSPIENNPADVWGMLHVCDPQTFGSYWNFTRRWMETYSNPWATKVLRVLPGQEREFDAHLREYMLRRLKKDHLPQLKEPSIIDVPVDPTATMKESHDHAVKSWILDHPGWKEEQRVLAKSAGALIQKLRVFVSTQGGEHNPKMEALKGIMEDLPREPIIIYTWFRQTAEIVSQILAKKRDVWTLHGGFDKVTRAMSVDDWKKCPDGVLVATMKSASEGLNLQHSKIVVFYEHDYIPSTMVQAVGRVHRDGQEGLVTVFHIYTRKTADEKTYRVARTRQSNNELALMEAVLDDI